MAMQKIGYDGTYMLELAEHGDAGGGAAKRPPRARSGSNAAASV